jgi:hypothetical protein
MDSPSSYSPVFIRLIRSDAKKDAKSDDRITIRREDGNMRVSYYDSVCKKSNSILLTNTGLCTYVATLIESMSLDDDPFEAIQLGFPGFPVLYYGKEKLDSYDLVRNVERMATAVQDSWFADTYREEEDGDCWANWGGDAVAAAAKNKTAPQPPKLPRHEFYYYDE